MKKNILYPAALMLTLLCSACLDQIDIDKPQRFDDGYVIQAKLIMGAPSYLEVKVGRLFQNTSNAVLEVRDAVVSIIDSLDNEYVLPSSDNFGVYRGHLSQTDFPVEILGKYHIQVLLKDGNLIVSDWDVIQPVPKMSAVNWALGETEVLITSGLYELKPAVNFFVSSPLYTAVTDSKSRLRWEFIDAYKIDDDLGYSCYIENLYKRDRVFLLDGYQVSDDELIDYPLFTERIGVRHIDGYYLTAFQQSISEDAFNYWDEVIRLTERRGSIFDQPAGTIRTNLRCVSDSTKYLYGYFYALAQDTFRTFLSREDMGNLEPYCPIGSLLPTICDSCLLAKGASYDKPFYWE